MIDFRHALEKAQPVVSWEVRPSASQITWVGTTNNRQVWEATFGISNKKSRFIIAKYGPAGLARKVSKYCRESSSVEDVYQAANIALDAVARGLD